MAAQPKSTNHRMSAKDREFEELLRRAALYLKGKEPSTLRVVRRKRVKAA